MVFSALRRLRYAYGAPPMDNFIFELCYRWTVLLLVTFSFIVTCRLVFGDSIKCSSDDRFTNSYVTTKCYDDGVYIIPEELENAVDGLYSGYLRDKLKRYQAYYPWVNLLFLVQAFNFYLPHLLWKTYERGYIYKLTAGVQKFFDREERRDLELCYLAKYALTTQDKHKRYMVIYLFFEACNFVIFFAQTLWLIYFFDVTGVPKISPTVIRTWSDFRRFYFPSNGRCDLYRYDFSGDLYSNSILCHLPLNSLYMKMFLFLQSWYILLTILCGLVLVYRIILLVPAFRIFVMKLSSPLSEKSVLTSVCYILPYSDWFFLSNLQNLMTDIDFAQLVDKISIVSQGKDESKSRNERSLSEYAQRDIESSDMTSPV